MTAGWSGGGSADVVCYSPEKSFSLKCQNDVKPAFLLARFSFIGLECMFNSGLYSHMYANTFVTT